MRTSPFLVSVFGAVLLSAGVATAHAAEGVFYDPSNAASPTGKTIGYELFRTIGCPGYPQGHPDIPDDALEAALREKARFVDHVTTQMDFDVKAIASWVRREREAGLRPEVVVGVPGVADPQKLLSIAARIGVKDAKRFLVKNLRFVTGLAKSGGFYKPTGFVEDIAPLLANPDAKVTGFHMYTFNAVEATEEWRQSMLETLAA